MTTMPPDAATLTTTHTRTRRRRYNWPRIKADYVEGITGDDGKITWPTFDVVADRNNALAQNIRTRAAREKWTEERAAFQARIDQQRQDERSTEIASLGADLDVQALRVAKNGLAITGARIQELGLLATERARAIQQNGGRVTADTPRAPSSEELGTLSRAAATWYQLGREAMGDGVRVHVDHSGTVQVDAELTVTERDEAALQLLAILQEAKVLPDGTVDTRAVLDVAGGSALEVGVAVDAEDEPVHPDDVGDTSEREQEAAGIPRARSA